MKANELRGKSTDELKQELLALLKEQFSLRMQKAARQLTNPSGLRKVKLSIARIKTILNEKGLKV